MVVRASEVASAELQTVLQTLKREATDQASLFLVVCIDEPGDAGGRSEKIASIINEVRWQANGEPPGERLCIADLELDRQRCEVTRARERVHLSPIEFKLLETLMLHHDRVLDVDFLGRALFRSELASAPYNILWVYIHRLRKKIDHAPCEPLIRTVRGHGYMLRSPAPSSATA